MKMHRNGDIQLKYVFLDGFNYFFMIFLVEYYNRTIYLRLRHIWFRYLSGQYFILKLYLVFIGANPEFEVNLINFSY